MNKKSIYKSAEGKGKILAIYDKVLSEWPVPCEHINIPTRFGNTFVIASGEKENPPLILLHGSGSNSATWAYDVIEYSRHLCVYAVDIPGEPGRSEENRFECRGNAFNEWLDDVLNYLNVDKAVLGGMSLGAWASLKYSVHKPERVGNLVLICPSGVGAPKVLTVMRLLAYASIGKPGRKRLIKLIFNNTPSSKDAEDFLILTSEYFRFRVESIPVFSDQELVRLNMPVLFLAGEKDIFIHPHKVAERLRKFVPDLTVNIYREGGHAIINQAKVALSFLGYE